MTRLVRQISSMCVSVCVCVCACLCVNMHVHYTYMTVVYYVYVCALQVVSLCQCVQGGEKRLQYTQN